MNRYICIHGHFYQPPRENPWLEEVELQDSAHPYHDWNERVTAECYGPNTASRIVDGENRIIDLVNNYSKISFNIGPTLCAWMERHKPDVLAAIIEADRVSKERFSGHGSAIAQVYNHMIMPLANRRDKYTQAYWGIMDFEKRFARFPEGMWLPETAVDIETLEVLAELKIKYAILAPRQARLVRPLDPNRARHDVGEGVDPTTAYLCELPSGNSINIFFYDGSISQDMAFGDLLENGERFAQRLMGAFNDARPWPQLVHVATDGESYGHHRRHGDMALAYCLHHIETTQQAILTNYGEYLQKHPPTHAVEIAENTSWSCLHGIERWRGDCGCNSGRQEWSQAWRQPLREALDSLRDALVPLFEEEASKLFTDPWKVRDEYLEVLSDRSRDHVRRFLARRATHEFSHEESVRALKLLEMQRNCMLMYTSCAWFFDELSGIETTQVLRYASKAIQDAEFLSGRSFEDEFTNGLALARSNVLENGARVYEAYVKPAQVTLERVGAHYGISSLFGKHQQVTPLYCYRVESESYKWLGAGRMKMAIGKTRIESVLTWEHGAISFAVVHFGDHNINGGVRIFMGEAAFAAMQQELIDAFERGEITEVLHLMLKHFGTNNYSVRHLFRDEQRQIIRDILSDTIHAVHLSLRTIYENNFTVMALLRSLQHPIPSLLVMPAEVVVSDQLKNLFSQETLDIEQLGIIAQQAEKLSLKLQPEELQLRVGAWITARVEDLKSKPLDVQALELLSNAMAALAHLHLDMDLWRAQNGYFSVTRAVYLSQEQKAAGGDPSARRWIAIFTTLGSQLQVRVR